jgi:hypothetical protein
VAPAKRLSRWLVEGFGSPGSNLAPRSSPLPERTWPASTSRSFRPVSRTGNPAWHWVEPAVRYAKAAEALRSRGYLAIWGAGHVIPYDGDTFFVEIQPVYDEIGERIPSGKPLPRPGELGDQREEIAASGLCDIVDIRQYDWETVYDAEGYIELLNTFSGHIAMADWQREHLYGEIRRRLSQRPDQPLRRHWGGVLHIAQRRD